MGVDAIYARSKNFNISAENVLKFLDKEEKSFDDLIEDVGWECNYSVNNDISKVIRNNDGWIRQDEFDFFKKLAPYVDDGAEIEFEIIYGGASYEKWVFENGTLEYYTGEPDIKWSKAKPDYR